MFRALQYSHSDLPNLASEKADLLAKQLYEEWRYRDFARQELSENIWKACDDAFQCKRRLPKNKGMNWADKSDFGDTDIRDGVLFLANAMVLALMPPDDSWLELYSFKSADQWRKNKMRDYQQHLHRKADTRGNYELHVTQSLVRGVSAISWEWRRVERLRRLGYTEAQVKAQFLSEMLGLPVDAQLLRQKERQPYVVYNGPVIQTLDMYDVYPDPTARIGSNDMPVAIMTYRTVEELKESVDEKGNRLYGNLKDLKGTSLSTIFHHQNQRYRSLQTLGINPLGYAGTDREYVPVLVFHRQLQTLDNSKDQWVDTFFEVALTGDFSGCRLIRAYENPSDYGSPCVFFDTYSDFIAATPYQTGVVEKALPAWQAKNVISALTLQADLTRVFPAVGIMADVLQNPKRVDIAPGGVNLLKRTNAGLKFVAPVLSSTGAQDGMQAQQFYGQKILGSMGAYGAIMQSPDRSITRAKTATQINTETTSGSIGRDNLLQKFALRSLEPLAQAILYASIQYNPEGIVEFERVVDGEIIGDTLDQSELDMDWKVVVTGQKAKINKAQAMQELQQAFQYATTANPMMMQMNPALVPLSNKILMTILAQLGIKDLDRFEQDPMQLLLKHPAIGQQIREALMGAYQQGAAGAAGNVGGRVLSLPGQQPPLGEEVMVA